MNSFLRKDWEDARDGLLEILNEHPESLDRRGEVLGLYGKKSKPYFPDYFLVICLCNLGQKEEAWGWFIKVREWFPEYPRIEGYVVCVINHCGQATGGWRSWLGLRQRQPCREPTELADAGASEASPLVRRPSPEPALCSPASPGVPAW